MVIQLVITSRIESRTRREKQRGRIESAIPAEEESVCVCVRERERERERERWFGFDRKFSRGDIVAS